MQIPGDILVTTYLTTMASLDYSQLIAVIVLSIVGLIIFSYLLTRKILPALGILKNRYLVEENDPQVIEDNNVASEAHKDVLDLIPPSSDRQGVVQSNEVMDK